MKRLQGFLICICCLLLLLGCSREPEAVIIDVTGASGPAPSPAPGETAGPEGEIPANQGSPKAEVRDTAAYAFLGAEGPALYGAVAYENTGGAPLVLTKASFTFSFDNATEEIEFTPVFNDKTVVLPGETAYAALWYSLADLQAGTLVSLSASLQWEESGESPIPIAVSNLHLAHNYPGFTTLAGTLTPQADCPCNLIYAGFYGAEGNFLGAWYFTENAQLIADEPKAFTSHLKEFPLADLAERAAEIRTFAIGME